MFYIFFLVLNIYCPVCVSQIEHISSSQWPHVAIGYQIGQQSSSLIRYFLVSFLPVLFTQRIFIEHQIM